MAVVTILDAIFFTELTDGVVVFTQYFGLCHRFGEVVRWCDDIFQACCLVSLNSFFPPLHWFLKFAAGEFLCAQAVTCVWRHRLQTGSCKVSLVLLRSYAIEFAVFIAGSFNTCITELLQLLENFFMCLSVIAGIEDCTDWIQLQCHLFLG